MTNDRQRTALIIGATGGVGGEAARALLKRGWRVRALRRQASGKERPDLAGIEWVEGDAMRAGDVLAAAAGAQVIVHGANPPGYHNWQGTVLPMIENTIAAAKASGATIVFPGTVYNFGPDAFPVLSEASPQTPKTRKGRLRVAMEQRLAAAAGDGVRTIVVRCGDFFGPRAGNNWFAQGLIKPGRPVTAITYPGRREIGHAWAYLPDVGETIARLVEARERLAPFAVFHMRGHWLDEGGEMAEAIRRAVGNSNLPIRRLPWPLVTLAAPFNETFREMLEMRYLWREPLRLDNARLVAFLGEEPHTPLDEAVRTTLEGLGCLPAAAKSRVRNLHAA